MTFDERIAALGVDLSDLPKIYKDAHTWYALTAAFDWDVMADEKRGEGILAAYVLHLTDIIDRMETRIVNLTEEQDYLLERLADYGALDCSECIYSTDGEECTLCDEGDGYGVWSGVPEDWSVDND